MNILKGYISSEKFKENCNFIAERKEYIETLQEKIENFEIESYVNLLKSPEFKAKYMNRLRKADEVYIAFTIRMINLVKTAYRHNENSCKEEIDIAKEGNNYAEHNHFYCDTSTPEFNNCQKWITYLIYKINNEPYSTTCSLKIEADDTCKQIIDFAFMDKGDYDGEYIYFFKRKDYPIVLALYDIFKENHEEIEQIILRAAQENL